MDKCAALRNLFRALNYLTVCKFKYTNWFNHCTAAITSEMLTEQNKYGVDPRFQNAERNRLTISRFFLVPATDELLHVRRRRPRLLGLFFLQPSQKFVYYHRLTNLTPPPPRSRCQRAPTFPFTVHGLSTTPPISHGARTTPGRHIRSQLARIRAVGEWGMTLTENCTTFYFCSSSASEFDELRSCHVCNVTFFFLLFWQMFLFFHSHFYFLLIWFA